MTEAPRKILIADDEPLFLRTTAELLRKAGYQCTTAPDGRTALEALAREPFDLVLSDLNMPGNLKLELLREGRSKWPHIPLIVITGAPSLPTAIESVRLGIADYLLKPVRYDDLLSSVRRALTYQTHSVGQLDTKIDGSRLEIPELVGESPAMDELREIIVRLSGTDANVLITGESGTGKEVVARAIHQHSRRRSGPLQVIDCTAIPESLFESVVFGHARGAFTGAVKDQPGLLLEADGGTAFFDEIGELPASLQAKLLRVIQNQTFTPVGKTEQVRIDTRFICATNRNLELEVNAGRFRRDLFYRLAVIHIELAPLRDREDDVILLANHFLKELARPGEPVKTFSGAALERMRSYGWPGNIRELRNAVERGVALARGFEIQLEDLPPALLRPVDSGTSDEAASVTAAPRATLPAGATSRAESLRESERDYLLELLKENQGNVARSAVQAGMSRQGLHKLLKKHDIDANEFRP